MVGVGKLVTPVKLLKLKIGEIPELEIGKVLKRCIIMFCIIMFCVIMSCTIMSCIIYSVLNHNVW